MSTMPMPVTVQDWIGAVRAGADVAALLRASYQKARTASPEAVWIHLATESEFAGQLTALEQIGAQYADREALLSTYPLYGVPFAVKDNIDIAGVPTTAACPAFEHIPSRSAGVVRKLVDAGAVWIGKTNMDQFATGLVGTRSPYGRPASALHRDYISGGSSSGSGVAVAAGLAAFSLGTDTAGSGRVPAAFNQIVGLKPTPGRIGASGVLPACRTLDCVSIFALTVEDAAHVLSVAEGADPEDSYSRFEPGVDAWQSDQLRIGVPRDPQFAFGGAYRKEFEAALECARSLGHSMVPIDFSVLDETAQLLYSGPWVAERYTVVADLMRAQPEAMDPTVRAVIGNAQRYDAADVFRAQYKLKDLQSRTAELWQRVDVLMVPTAPGHPTFGEVDADPVGANSLLGLYTNFVNLQGWCALAVPASRTAEGLPFGVTFIAPAGYDRALARFGQAWESAVDLPLGATGVRRNRSATIPMRLPAVLRSMPLCVVGAHLSGMPLNGQLVERGARLAQSARTSPAYRLYALPGTTPPKPGLVRTTEAGSAIEVEVWDMPMSQLGSFLSLIAAPLGLGSVELADGTWVHGFICEGHAVQGATDISAYGGWRTYMKAREAARSADERTNN